MSTAFFLSMLNEAGHVQESNNLSKFHPYVFRKLNHFFDVPIFDRFDFMAELNSQTYQCINLFLLSTKYSYLTGAGALFVIEETIPSQLSLILNRLQQLNVPEDSLEFLQTHVSLDSNHVDGWWKNCIVPFLNTKNDHQKLFLGVILGIQARNLLWDALYDKVKH